MARKKKVATETASGEETPSTRFMRLAEVRASKALDAIALLKALALNPKSYEYDEDQKETLLGTLEAAVAECREAFDTPAEDRGKKTRTKSFTFATE